MCAQVRLSVIQRKIPRIFVNTGWACIHKDSLFLELVLFLEFFLELLFFLEKF